MIAIVDYGLGNLASVKNMLKKAGAASEITSDGARIAESEKIILPGVGAFATGMHNLRERGLVEVLQQYAQSGKPMLGICLGAQLMTKYSEEGDVEGLGIFDARTHKFRFDDPTRKVPHMGWSSVNIQQPNHPLFANLTAPRFYFVHSYYMQAEQSGLELTTCIYGHSFAAGLAEGKVAGVQFHPEKSHVFGLELMKNFAAWK